MYVYNIVYVYAYHNVHVYVYHNVYVYVYHNVYVYVYHNVYVYVYHNVYVYVYHNVYVYVYHNVYVYRAIESKAQTALVYKNVLLLYMRKYKLVYSLAIVYELIVQAQITIKMTYKNCKLASRFSSYTRL